jgi:predicted amidohydrolase YtcJ
MLKKQIKLTGMRIKAFRACLIFFSLMIMVHIHCQKQMPRADLILTNGVFFTVNPQQPGAEALAVKGDRILAIGKYSELEEYRGHETRVVDLRGAFVCPGFNDAHVDLLDGVLASMELDVKGVPTIPRIRRMITDKIRDLGVGEWVLGRGWDQDVLLGGEWPVKYMLDRAAYNWPVFLRRECGHVAWVNTLALKIANITSETPDPPGGEIVRDPGSENPTGLLKGKAIDLITQYFTPVGKDKIRPAIKNTIDELKKYGLTSLQDHGSPEVTELFHDLLEQDKLTCRLTKALPLEMDLEDYRDIRKQYNGLMLRIGHLYAEFDGRMSSRTAAFLHPYLDEPSNRGFLLVDPETLRKRLLFARNQDCPVAVGAVGDAANQLALDYFQRIENVAVSKNNRFRLEHAQVLNQEALRGIRSLDLVVSAQPFHCIDGLNHFETRIGSERCRYVHAWRSLKNHGAVLAFGSGWPRGPIDPMEGLYAAVTRRDTLGHPLQGWYAQERLTIEEAIEAYTLGSAYAEGMESEKGSLEPGKLADMVVLDRNLLTIAAENIRKTKVEYTILGGKIIYTSDKASATHSED